MLFTANDWLFGLYLHRWFEMDRRDGAAVSLALLADACRPSNTLTTQALLAFEAAESLHRALHPQSTDTEEKHAERPARILDEVQGKDRKWLKWTLKYAYEPTFEERLGGLISDLGELASVATGSGERWAHDVAQTRNVLAHGLSRTVDLAREAITCIG